MERPAVHQLTWISGALLAALAVLTGAFGAHGLRERLSAEALAWWQTAAHYHLLHAVGLVAIGAAGPTLHPRRAGWAAGLLLAGVLLFSGSLYAMALTGLRGLGAVTPLGGLAMVAGWVVVATATRRDPHPVAQ